MRKLLLQRIPLPLNNERGIAALVTIILAIIILGSVAFNFIAETRQKQAGSILTYTSTNSLMIAEAGLRYTQKCLTAVDAAWGCPTVLQNNADWTTITAADDFNKDFGGDGNFAVSFPVNAGNDAGKIFVISTGTFKGGQRSLSRFIARACVLGDNAITSCLGTTTKNNSFVDPPLPDPPVTGECPDDPPGFVDIPDAPVECDSCPSASCPDFDTGSHLLAGNILDPTFTRFCDFNLSGSDEVKTNEDDHSTIVVKKDLEIKDLATLKLNDDGPDTNQFTAATNDKLTVAGHTYVVDDQVGLFTTDTLPAGLSDSATYFVIDIVGNTFKLSLTASPGSPVDITDTGTGTHTVTSSAIDTTINVYGNATLKNSGDIRVKGALTLQVDGTYDMKNASRVNNNEGLSANASAWVEGNVSIKNSSLFIGSVATDGTLTLKNNAEIQGALFGNEVVLKNNATVVFTDNEDAGSNTEGYNQCSSGASGQVWSE